MLSLIRARLAQPATRLLRTGASVNLLSARSETGLLSLGLSQQVQRGIASSAVKWEHAAKKTTAKAKTAGRTKAKPKTGKTKVAASAKKKPAAKKAASKKSRGKPKSKTAAKPKPGIRALSATFKPVKRAPAPFAIFMGKFIKGSNLPKGTLPEMQAIAKEASRVWREFSDFEKQPFVEEFKKLRDEHDKQLAAYSEKAIQNGSEFRRMNSLRTSKGLQARRIPKGFRRPANSFLLFYQEKLPTLTGATTIERSREAGRLWKAMSDKQQQVYKDQSAKAMAEFKKQHGL